MSKQTPRDKITLGWREWIGLPELGVQWIKAKVDTGARTSALHVHGIEELREENDGVVLRVRIHPHQRSGEGELVAEVLAHDQRPVTSSVGHRQHRYVIETPVRIGDREFSIEISLTNRDAMGFRMLLGRTAVRQGYLVDAKQSYLLGKPPKK